MKNFNILTLFPELFPGPLGVSIFNKSFNKLWSLEVLNLLNYGIGQNKTITDKVFGGLPGMLIKPEVIMNCMQSLCFNGKKIFLSPRGKLLNQKKVEHLIEGDDNFLILCGRYEGIDQRAIDYYDFEEISIGHYIISGGESAAFVLLESMIRKIPGVVGNSKVFELESFSNDDLSEDRYTRPASWRVDNKVIEIPDVFLAGNHKKIEDFRKNNKKKNKL